MKQDLLFYVADKNIEGLIRGFMEDRDEPHRALGLSRALRREIKVATGESDPGIYAHAEGLLRPYTTSYERVIVLLDEAWLGSPGAAKIQQTIESQLTRAGWPAPTHGRCLVFVPEADTWIWTSAPCTATELGWPDLSTLHSALRNHLPTPWLAPDSIKPAHPKEAAEWAVRQMKRKRRDTGLYRRIAKSVSLQRCQDPTAQQLLQTLWGWFS